METKSVQKAFHHVHGQQNESSEWSPQEVPDPDLYLQMNIKTLTVKNAETDVVAWKPPSMVLSKNTAASWPWANERAHSLK